MTSTSTSRIAKNTLLLYFRMLLTMGVSLYTSRVILNALGVEDYGIYNVVGGVVAMFGILSGSLSAAISRFITFELGKGDFEKLKRIFCTSVNIQIILIAIITVLMETIGIWFLNAKMVIPEERLAAANWVFQFSVVTFALNLLSVPYNAVIIAHEKMSAFAYISIIDCTLKLIVAFIIAYNPFDKLVYYGLLIMIVGAINRSIYAIYCKKHFEEATYKMIFDKGLMKEMFGFAGWDFFGHGSSLLKNQGGNILVNLFFGTTVNAARGISMQVGNAIISFTRSFMTAIRPQITKCYASGEKEELKKYVFYGTKFSFFIFLFPAVPAIITTPYWLEIWLVDVPEHTINFVRLAIIDFSTDILGTMFNTAVYATGNIRKYNLVVFGFELTNIPLSWLLLKFGCPPETVFVVAISVATICEMLKLWVQSSVIGLPVKEFLKTIYFKAIFVAILSFIPPFLVQTKIQDNLYGFISVVFISLLSVAITVFCIGCNSSERKMIIGLVKQKLKSK